MEKNKFVLIHHIATMIGVAESSILLKRQHKKRKLLVLFWLTQLFALFKISMGYVLGKDFFEESYENLKKYFTQKTSFLTVLVVISVFFKIGFHFLFRKEK